MGNQQDMGASPTGDRAVAASPSSPSVSPVPASIPSAWSLSYSDIRAIYDAGIKRGTDEATSFEWGERPRGKWHDELAEALYDIVNEGQRYGEPGFHDWDAVEAWTKAQEAQWQTALAQAIEARRAETHSGSVHESPVAEGHAPEGGGQ